MDALKAWRFSSHLLIVALRAAAPTRTRSVKFTVRCCSSSSSAAAAPAPSTAPNSGTSDRRRRGASSSTSDRDSIRAIRLKKVIKKHVQKMCVNQDDNAKVDEQQDEKRHRKE